MTKRRLVGHLGLGSAQTLLLDPVRLRSESEYQRGVDVTLAKKAGEVQLREEKIEVTNDGVAVEIGSDGEFPVYVEHTDDGWPTSIHIDVS
jgi:hypothetical protein